MDPLVWIAVIAGLLVVIHLAVAVYLYQTATAADGPIRSRAESDRAGETPGQSTDAAERRVACPACGTPNDPSYRFCRRCVADLSSDGPLADDSESSGRLGN